MDRFNNFIKQLQQHNPSLCVAFKEDSIFMKLLGTILFFNKKFMTEYTTTIGNTIYFPSKQYIETNETNAIVIASHEYYHTQDHKHLSFLFFVLYLIPQILVIGIIPGIILFHWWALFFLIFILPLPAYGRKYLEFHGYSMSLFCMDLASQEAGYSNEQRLAILNKSATYIDEQYFKGSAYYYTWVFGVRKEFDTIIEKIISGDILNTSYAYTQVKAAFKNSKTG